MKVTTKYDIGDKIYFAEAKSNLDPYFPKDIEWKVENYEHEIKSVTIEKDKILYCVDCRNEVSANPLNQQTLKYVNEIYSFLTYDEAVKCADSKNAE